MQVPGLGREQMPIEEGRRKYSNRHTAGKSDYS